MTKQELEAILWQAVHSPCGLHLKVTDREAFKRRVYAYIGKARADGEDGLNNLAIKRDATDPQGILLIKKEALPNAKTE